MVTKLRCVSNGVCQARPASAIIPEIAGAEFVVMICGDVMTMPGLPKVPSATRIDIDEHGKVVGLF